MKIFRHIFSALLTFCMIFVLTCSSVFATETVDSKSKNIPDEYINNTLSYYLTLGNEVYDQVEISDPIPIENHSNDTSRMYFITNDGEYIGQLIVSSLNNQYYSNFMFDDNAEINNVISSNTPFALIAFDGVESDYLVMQTALNNTCISGKNQNSLAQFKMPASELTSASFSSFNLTQNYMRASNDYYVSLPVRYVSNDTSPDGDGVCWAACIAAISNYRNDTSYDAMDIYNALDNKYSGTPVGNNTWYKRGYKYCGMSYNQTSGMEFTDLYDVLDSDRPAIFSVSRSGGSHAIVCKYLSGGNEYATYGFMDPNRASTVYIRFDDPNVDPDNFVYDNGQHTYDSWNYTRY